MFVFTSTVVFNQTTPFIEKKIRGGRIKAASIQLSQMTNNSILRKKLASISLSSVRHFMCSEETNPSDDVPKRVRTGTPVRVKSIIDFICIATTDNTSMVY
eukprot:scaffold14825_cov20-Cyclotella_meneghiniana.AAC.3